MVVVKSMTDSNLIYQYDGSFDGLMCCVFSSFDFKEIPGDILVENNTMLNVRKIETDIAKAERVKKSISAKLGNQIYENVKLLYLCDLSGRERLILMYLRFGYSYGRGFDKFLDDEFVCAVNKAIKNLFNERHRYLMFIRFSDFNGALVAQIDPKNNLLPLLGGHFRNRFPNESFMIYDKTHGIALVYDKKVSAIIPVDEYIMPEATKEELKFRKLFKLFYDTIEIKERHNEKLRMGHMPKRYWSNMTEFCTEFD